MQLDDTIKLYSFADRDRSGRVRWNANELGIAYEEERVAGGAQLERPYLDINPWGRIPAIASGGESLGESGAICMWMAECRPQAQLVVPMGDPLRAAFLEWVFFACTTLESAAYSLYFEKHPKAMSPALERLDFLLRNVERHLATTDYAVAERFTVADILLGYVLELCRRRNLLEAHPSSIAYVCQLASRPAARSAGLFLDDTW